jgi:hypothetical protein
MTTTMPDDRDDPWSFECDSCGDTAYTCGPCPHRTLCEPCCDEGACAICEERDL